MAMPFPSTEVSAETRLDNAPKFDDLDRLAIGDIAALPPEMLLTLQEAALAETAPAFARLEALLFSRTSWADMARPAISKMPIVMIARPSARW